MDISIGVKSNEHYDKVEKYFAKHEEKILYSKWPRRGHRGGNFRGPHPYYGHQYGQQTIGYGVPSAAAGSPAQVAGPSNVIGQGYPQPRYFRQPLDKSKMRCNKCQELGHLYRECPNNFVAK